ncbi:MAG: hypothetical protein FWD77_11750, partial [Betaproteobacteria bacterium]|nr:hypothetical protein [Betaproteobacteria bacterium]
MKRGKNWFFIVPLKRLLLSASWMLALCLAVALPARAASSGATIDMADAAPPASGTGWSYSGNIYTIAS